MTLFDAESRNADPGVAVPPPRLPGAPQPQVKLVVAYDGTDFSGFATQSGQPGVRTVGGALAGAIGKVLGHEVRLACAGRTDAGVHAWGQVASFPSEPGLDPWRLQAAVTSMLGPEIVIRSAELVDPQFDARHAAVSRTYRYTILNRPAPDPFRDRFTWWVPEPLDLRALRLAADPFVGEHDFASFCRKGPEGSSTTRRVLDSTWVDEGDGVLRYEIRGNAFCWQLVRSIVGTLVEVGFGKRRPGEMLGILRAADRSAAGQLAPPRGLCLWEVAY